MAYTLGIDFGTTNTAAAIGRDGETTLLDLDPSAEERQLFRTLLYFPTRKEAFFGQQAVTQYFERDMEGRFLQSIKKLLPNPDFSGTAIHGQRQSIEDLIARFLTETRLRIEKTLGRKLAGIPVTMGRPARYSPDDEREKLATDRFRRACALSGFGDASFLAEPVAASRTYRLEGSKEEHVLIADLGGGTSDFTLLRINPTRRDALSVHGIPLAGDSIDSAFFTARLLAPFGADIRYVRPFSENVLTLPTAFLKLLPKWHHHAFLRERSTWDFLKNLHKELVDPARDKPALDNLITLVEDNLGYSLHERVEALKKALSASESARFSFKSHPIQIEFEVTREDLEAMALPIAEAVAQTGEETARRADVEPARVDAVYFTGGTSRMPLMRARIMARFPRARVAEREAFTSVAAGLAMAAP